MSDHSFGVVSYVLLFVCALIWSFSFVFIKVALETIPPETIAFGRLGISAFVLGCILTIRRSVLPTRKTWGLFFIIAPFSVSIPFIIIPLAQKHVESGIAGILMGAVPIATLLLALLTKVETFRIRNLVGILVGFVGIVILVGPDVHSGAHSKFWGEMVIVAATLCYAIGIVLSRRIPKGISPMTSAFGIQLCGAIQTLPFVIVLNLWDGTAWISQISWGSALSVIALGAVAGSIAAICFFHLIATTSASFASFVNYIMPVLASFWGVWFMSEDLAWNVFVALFVILTGIAITNLTPSRIESIKHRWRSRS